MGRVRGHRGASKLGAGVMLLADGGAVATDPLPAGLPQTAETEPLWKVLKA